MKVHNVVQGSPEWLACRLGIPTCSQFDRILTPKTRKPSAQSEKYLIELCTEWLLGQPVDAASSQWMLRGSDLEPEAVAHYEFTYDVTVERVGFATTDDGRWGGSPDGLVGDDGLIEIKCLSAVNHVAALLGATDDSYVLQIQGYMLLTGRQWIDRVWFNPDIRSVVQRVERDAETCDQLAEALDDFCERLDAMKAKLIGLGCKPKRLTTADDAAFDEAWSAEADSPSATPVLSKMERATALAARLLALPTSQEQETLYSAYMLHRGDKLALSINGLSDGMLAELEAELGCIEKGI